MNPGSVGQERELDRALPFGQRVIASDRDDKLFVAQWHEVAKPIWRGGTDRDIGLTVSHSG